MVMSFWLTFLAHAVYAPIYCLAIVSDTGDVGPLMTIKMQ